MSSETRTYWLSFASEETGQNLGVAIVDVTPEQAAIEKAWLDERFPQHLSGAEWIGAAARVAWDRKCNPGGQIRAHQVPSADFDPSLRNRLLQRDELRELGLIA